MFSSKVPATLDADVRVSHGSGLPLGVVFGVGVYVLWPRGGERPVSRWGSPRRAGARRHPRAWPRRGFDEKPALRPPPPPHARARTRQERERERETLLHHLARPSPPPAQNLGHPLQSLSLEGESGGDAVVPLSYISRREFTEPFAGSCSFPQ